MKIIIILLTVIFPRFTYAEEDLSKRVQILEEKVNKLESLILNSKGNDITELKPITEKGEILLALTSWEYVITKQRSSEYYDIKYTISSNYSKSIKLIDGGLYFYDLLGERVYGISLDKDQIIEAGKESKQSGLYSINPYINDDSRMKNMKKEDIVAKLKIKKIVFSDNTVLDFTK